MIFNPLIEVAILLRGIKPKYDPKLIGVGFLASIILSVGLACEQDSTAEHTPVTPQSSGPTDAKPTPTPSSAAAAPVETPVVPTPTTPPATATPDAASLIAGLSVGPLPVYEFTPLYSDVDGSWLEAILSLMPDSEDVREIIWMQNMLPIWEYCESHGYPRPTVDDGHEGYYNYFLEIPRPKDGVPILPQISSEHMPWISGITDYMFSASTFSTMGFDPRNVDIAAAGGKQPFVLEAVVGRYDPEITRASLANCADCMPHAESRHLGYAYYSWGEDFKGKLQERLSPPRL